MKFDTRPSRHMHLTTGSFWVCYKSRLTADSGVALREIQSLRERESLWEESILILCSELCYLCNKKLESMSQTDQSIPLICAGQCKLAEPCNWQCLVISRHFVFLLIVTALIIILSPLDSQLAYQITFKASSCIWIEDLGL